MSNLEAPINALIAQQVKPLWNALDEAKQRQIEMQKRHEAEREEWTNEKKEMKERIDMLESSLKKEDEKRQDVELRVLRNELGELGGAGHFWRNDKAPGYGGERGGMDEVELMKVLRLLEAGEKKINLKLYFSGPPGYLQPLKVAGAGWTILFKTFCEAYGGDGKNSYLWIEKKYGRAKFKATAQQIEWISGEETNRRELQSEMDGLYERIKYENIVVADFCYVRFNITLL